MFTFQHLSLIFTTCQLIHRNHCLQGVKETWGRNTVKTVTHETAFKCIVSNGLHAPSTCDASNKLSASLAQNFNAYYYITRDDIQTEVFGTNISLFCQKELPEVFACCILQKCYFVLLHVWLVHLTCCVHFWQVHWRQTAHFKGFTHAQD